MIKYLKMINQILEPAPNNVVHIPSIKNKKMMRKYLLIFRLTRMRVTQFCWAQLDFVAHLARAHPGLGKVFNL